MAGIVLELQHEALDKSIRVSDLLRKALLVAKKLKISELESWILSELNGYSNTNKDSFPEYRWISGQIRSFNPYNGMWLPIMFPESEAHVHRALTRRPCIQSIAEIESLIPSAKDGQLSMPYSAETQSRLIKAADLPSPPVLIVAESRLHGIVDAVRTTILDWALKLEENGIRGENLSFTDEDRKTASHMVFNIGSMTHSQIQADTSHSQQVITNLSIEPKAIIEFITQARHVLSDLQLEQPESQELNSELDTIEAQAKSPKPKTHILREALKSVRSILEGAAGKIAADGLLNVIDKINI